MCKAATSLPTATDLPGSLDNRELDVRTCMANELFVSSAAYPKPANKLATYREIGTG